MSEVRNNRLQQNNFMELEKVKVHENRRNQRELLGGLCGNVKKSWQAQ